LVPATGGGGGAEVCRVPSGRGGMLLLRGGGRLDARASAAGPIPASVRCLACIVIGGGGMDDPRRAGGRDDAGGGTDDGILRLGCVATEVSPLGGVQRPVCVSPLCIVTVP
jgi:hypothetical protein